MINSLKRTAEILHQEGFRSLGFKFLGETVYRRLDIFEKNLETVGVPDPDAEGLDIEPLNAADVDEFLAFRSYAPREKVLERLAQGQLCFVVRRQGSIVHCSWSTTDHVRIDYIGCEVLLEPDVIYVYESYTAPNFRGQSISQLRSKVVHRHYRDRGYRRYLSVSWPENKAARLAICKSGARITGRMGYWGVGRFKRYFCTNEKHDPPLRLMSKRGQDIRARSESYWSQVPEGMDARRHYLDPFLADLKRRENLRLVENWGGLGPGSKILKTDAFEEAMGADTFLADLQGDGRTIIGMDVSSEIAGRASENNAASGIRFIAADVRCLPLLDASFSVIVSPSTLDHFPDPSDLGVSLRELFRIIKPGGRLVITLDNRQNLFDPLLKLVHGLGMVPFYMGKSYTISELTDELCQAGFEVRKTTAILHNPRLVAVAVMRAVRRLRWRPLIRLTEETMLAAQGLENTRLCYFTGSFVAALAIRPVQERDSYTKFRNMEYIKDGRLVKK